MIQIQLVGILVIIGIFKLVEKKAAMRGCNRAPLPPYLDKALRLVFLGFLVGPSSLWIDLNLLPFPVLTPLLMLYAIPYSDLTEQRGGRKNLVVRKLSLWRWFYRYFDLKLERTVPLPADRSYIFGAHPHSILPFGSQIALGADLEGGFSELFPGIQFRVLAATFCFYVPFYRDLLMFGGVVDAARYSANYILSNGYSLALVPGGATEALHCHPDYDVVYIRKRRGFVRLALEHGASLVPVFSFNENNTYSQLAVDSSFVKSLKKKFQSLFGISLPLITNIFPKRTAITVLVGAPVHCPKIENPSNEQIDSYLEQYIDSLETLYNENREKYNNPKTKPKLQIL